jgi:hypothetical protein
MAKLKHQGVDQRLTVNFNRPFGNDRRCQTARRRTGKESLNLLASPKRKYEHQEPKKKVEQSSKLLSTIDTKRTKGSQVLALGSLSPRPDTAVKPK